MASISTRTSRMCWKRRLASFWRQRRNRSLTLDGVAAGRASQAGCRGDLYVGGLHVPVRHSLQMCRFQPFRDLARYMESLLEWHRADPLHPLGKRFPFDKFHHQELLAETFFKPVNSRNIGMIQRS